MGAVSLRLPDEISQRLQQLGELTARSEQTDFLYQS